jgi:hypothetical protein
MKRNLTWLAASVAALCAGAAGAQTSYPPQPGYGYGNDDATGQARTVRCESRDSRLARCRIDGAGDVRITRQLSRQQCIQGRNWDYTRNEIRVSGGCRAEFLVAPRNDYGYDDRRGRNDGYRNGQGQVVRCDSRSQGRTYCGDGYGQYTMIGYRNANCVEGRTFGQDQRGLWVAGNCNAQFRRIQGNDHNRYGRGEGRQDEYATTVRCFSNSSGRSYCGDADARYTLRDTSNRYCVEGRTWGTDQRGLWVTNPCQGEFVRQPFYDDPRDNGYREDSYGVEPYDGRYQRD